MPLRNVASSFNESHLVYFAQRSNALLNFIQAAFAQSDHTFVAGDALNFGGGPAVNDHFANAVGEVEQFANGGAAVVPRAGTFQTTGAFGEQGVDPFFRLEAGFAEFVGRQAFLLFAIGADHADEALREDAIERGNEVVWLDAHVDEAADDVGDVVGVDGGENEVAGQSGLNGDLRGFLIADFADHDFVGVVAQDGAQASREGEAFFLVHGNLGDAAKLIFDRIFDGDDFVFVGFDFIDGGVKGGGFTGTGWTGDEDHAVRLANVAAKAAHFFG